MHDLQSLIEQIRVSIAFPETVPADRMRIYASRYAEACAELNRRMMQSVQQIRSGNCSEGVRLAELKPNLTELYMVLDFAEREDWYEIVSMLGFDIPPPLSAELATELNDAYLRMAPLEPLLRLHRLHALNDSSLQERLAVLRALAKADRENIFWAEDQEKFESARIMQLETEIPKAIETKNTLHVRLLYQEINAPDWIVPRPAVFRQRLFTSVLQDHAESLMEKFAVFDDAAAVTVYDSMQQILESEQMPMPPTVQSLIRPAVQWLNETKQQNTLRIEFDRHVSALEKALGKETPASHLKRLYYALDAAAGRAAQAIPPDLENLYHAEIARQYRAIRRQNRIVVLACITVCLLIGGLVAAEMWKRTHDKQVAMTMESLELIEKNRKFEDIPSTLKRIEQDSPELAKDPRVVVQMERLRSLWNDDEKRVQDFLRHHAEARTKLDASDKSDLSELERIRIFIDQAEKLARTSSEKSDCTTLKQEYERQRRDRIRQINGKYTESLTSIENELRDVKRNTNLTPVKSLSLLDDLDMRLKTLQQYSVDVDNSIKSQSVFVEKLLAEHQKEMKRKQEEDEAMNDLIAAVPDWSRYQEALRRLGTDFPKHPAAADSAHVLKESPVVKEAVMLLQDLVTSFSKNEGDFKNLYNDSTPLWRKYQKIATRISSPSATVFRPGNHLEKLSKMIPYSPGALKSVEPRLEELIQHEVFPWVAEDGQWYYLKKLPTGPGNYPYITSFVEQPAKIYTITRSDWNATKIPRVTQRIFADEAMKKIKNIKDDPETVVGDLISGLQNESGIDPILQCILMDLLIDDMSEIDPFFESNFIVVREIIRKSGVNQFTTWMDTQSRNVVQLRERAKTEINTLPKIPPLIDKIRRDRAQFQTEMAQFRPRFEWVALLIRQDGKWICAMKPGSTDVESGDLFIFRQKALDHFVQPVKIGQVSAGKVELLGGSASFLQCLPVFLVRHDSPVAQVAIAPAIAVPDKRIAENSPASPRKPVEDGSAVIELKVTEGMLMSAAFSPDGKKVVTAADGPGGIRIWNAESGKELKKLEWPASTASFLANGKKIVTSHYQTARIWDAESGEMLYEIEDIETLSVGRPAVSPDGKKIATADRDGDVQIWDVESGKLSRTLKKHEIGVRSVVFSPDGTKILTTEANGGPVVIWDVDSGKELRTLHGGFWNAAFSPKGEKIVTTDYNIVQIWNVESGKELKKIGEHTNMVFSIAFSPDGTKIALTYDGGDFVRIREAKSWKELQQLGCAAWSADFSPDGKKVVTSCHDGVRIWDVTSGKEIKKLEEDALAFWSAVFSPDGKKIATKNSGNTVCIWIVE